MLTDEDLARAAEAYARQHYGEGHGDDYTLIKTVQLSDPPGAHFFARYPPAGQLIGDGGFFIARADGHVTPLGSGDFVSARMELGDPMLEVDEAEIIRRIMIAKNATP